MVNNKEKTTKVGFAEFIDAISKDITLIDRVPDGSTLEFVEGVFAEAQKKKIQEGRGYVYLSVENGFEPMDISKMLPVVKQRKRTANHQATGNVNTARV